MALSIKDEATDRIVRRYAGLHRTSYTRAVKQAVTKALRAEGHEVGPDDEWPDFATFATELAGRVAALPTLDDRTDDEIVGYDEHGVPV